MNPLKYLLSPWDNLDLNDDNIVSVYKPVGMTPLEVIDQFKREQPSQAAEKISYAGRLDPMAEGVLILLIGQANKDRDRFLHLSKKYEVEVLLGMSTDSFDLLGLITAAAPSPISKEKFNTVLGEFRGEILQKFPPYSSKTVHGKPLYYWARHNKLNEIDIPVKKREIKAITCTAMEVKKGHEIYRGAVDKISLVKGNFRQEVILAGWETFLKIYGDEDFTLATMQVEGSSGIYMRQLAVDIGTALQSPSLAYHIKRTAVGSFTL